MTSLKECLMAWESEHNVALGEKIRYQNSIKRVVLCFEKVMYMHKKNI